MAFWSQKLRKKPSIFWTVTLESPDEYGHVLRRPRICFNFPAMRQKLTARKFQIIKTKMLLKVNIGPVLKYGTHFRQ